MRLLYVILLCFFTLAASRATGQSIEQRYARILKEKRDSIRNASTLISKATMARMGMESDSFAKAVYDSVLLKVVGVSGQRLADSTDSVRAWALGTFLGITDTAAMLAGYARLKALADTSSAIRLLLAGKLGIADTAAMLADYARAVELDAKQDTGVITPIRLGGTGSTTAQAALNALAIPAGNSGKVLGSDGVNIVYVTMPTSVGSVYSPDTSVLISPISGTGTVVALSNNYARRGTWTVPQRFTVVNADTLHGKLPLSDIYPAPTTGTVTSITASSPLTGGTITGSGSIGLGTTGTAGTYGGNQQYTAITTDAYGRVSGVTTGTMTISYSNVLGTPTALSFTSPLVLSTNTVSIPAATSSTNGYLTSTDWTTFNNKGSGTVTAVNAGYGITGSNITTSGTHGVDSAKLLTVASGNRIKDTLLNTAVFPAATQTLTNKRIEYRTTTVSSYTTSVAINIDNFDRVVDTAQSGSLLLAAPNGTASEGQELIYTITAATGTISLTYNSVFVPSTNIPVLPTGTAATTYRTIKMKFIYNQRVAKWFIVAKDTW